jgi:hypothetical protein
MVVALIVIGVILFLVFDAWLFRKVFKGNATADDYGSFHVPGETTVTIPAGKLKISYQESYNAGGTEDSIDFGVPASLEVSVTGSSGEPVELKGPGFRGMGASLQTGGGWSRALIGTAEVSAGTYSVAAKSAPDDAIEPQVLVGK